MGQGDPQRRNKGGLITRSIPGIRANSKIVPVAANSGPAMTLWVKTQKLGTFSTSVYLPIQEVVGLFDHLVGTACVCFWTAGSM